MKGKSDLCSRAHWNSAAVGRGCDHSGTWVSEPRSALTLVVAADSRAVGGTASASPQFLAISNGCSPNGARGSRRPLPSMATIRRMGMERAALRTRWTKCDVRHDDLFEVWRTEVRAIGFELRRDAARAQVHPTTPTGAASVIDRQTAATGTRSVFGTGDGVTPWFGAISRTAVCADVSGFLTAFIVVFACSIRMLDDCGAAAARIPGA